MEVTHKPKIVFWSLLTSRMMPGYELNSTRPPSPTNTMLPHLRVARIAIARAWSLAEQSAVRPNPLLPASLFRSTVWFEPDREMEAENKPAHSCLGLPYGAILKLPPTGLAGVSNWSMRDGKNEHKLLAINRLFSPQGSAMEPDSSIHPPLHSPESRPILISALKAIFSLGPFDCGVQVRYFAVENHTQD
jgi:hypothetical protein